MKGDDIRLLYEFIKSAYADTVFGAVCLIDEGVIGNDVHFKSFGTAGGYFADGAKPHDSDRLSLQFHSGAAYPLPISGGIVEIGNASCHGQDQGKCEFSNSFCVDAGRVGYRDAFCLGGRDIHAVVSGAITRDDLEMVTGIYHLLGDRIQPCHVSVAVF